MEIEVHYPLANGELRLRSDADWERDVLPVAAEPERGRFRFELDDERAFRYVKPVLVGSRAGTGAAGGAGGAGAAGGAGGAGGAGASGAATLRWAQGENVLALRDGGEVTRIHPWFDPDERCEVCTLQRLESAHEGACDYRVFLPPGYHENTLGRYPVLYMQDGRNLFFPEEAFGGNTWRVSETLAVLDSMNLLRRCVVVGVHPVERERQYTAPGYEAYGRFLVEELKPWVDRHYRTLPGPEHTAVMGSSLGGVVSLHLGLRHPQVFGLVAALSSTFGFRDDLLERVQRGCALPRRIYLDSGWPHDNYEVTRGMHRVLQQHCGCAGTELLHLAHPHARHDEASWARRLHLPMQFLFRAAEPAA